MHYLLLREKWHCSSDQFFFKGTIYCYYIVFDCCGVYFFCSLRVTLLLIVNNIVLLVMMNMSAMMPL